MKNEFVLSVSIACDQNKPGDQVEETDTAGNSVLTYDALSDHYKYVGQTNKLWKGTCWMLVVRLKDGSDNYAKFRFR